MSSKLKISGNKNKLTLVLAETPQTLEIKGSGNEIGIQTLFDEPAAVPTVGHDKPVAPVAAVPAVDHDQPVAPAAVPAVDPAKPGSAVSDRAGYQPRKPVVQPRLVPRVMPYPAVLPAVRRRALGPGSPPVAIRLPPLAIKDREVPK